MSEHETLTDEQIVAMTNEVFAEEFEIEPAALVPGAQIFADLGLDSLDVVDLVVALQAKFAITIRSDERVRAIRTLGDVYAFIGRVRSETQAS